MMNPKRPRRRFGGFLDAESDTDNELETILSRPTPKPLIASFPNVTNSNTSHSVSDAEDDHSAVAQSHSNSRDNDNDHEEDNENENNSGDENDNSSSSTEQQSSSASSTPRTEKQRLLNVLRMLHQPTASSKSRRSSTLVTAASAPTTPAAAAALRPKKPSASPTRDRIASLQSLGSVIRREPSSTQQQAQQQEQCTYTEAPARSIPPNNILMQTRTGYGSENGSLIWPLVSRLYNVDRLGEKPPLGHWPILIDARMYTRLQLQVSYFPIFSTNNLVQSHTSGNHNHVRTGYAEFTLHCFPSQGADDRPRCQFVGCSMTDIMSMTDDQGLSACALAKEKSHNGYGNSYSNGNSSGNTYGNSKNCVNDGTDGNANGIVRIDKIGNIQRSSSSNGGESHSILLYASIFPNVNNILHLTEDQSKKNTSVWYLDLHVGLQPSAVQDAKDDVSNSQSTVGKGRVKNDNNTTNITTINTTNNMNDSNNSNTTNGLSTVKQLLTQSALGDINSKVQDHEHLCLYWSANVTVSCFGN